MIQSYLYLKGFVRWQLVVTVLQRKNKLANRKRTSKFKKYLHWFGDTCPANICDINKHRKALQILATKNNRNTLQVAKRTCKCFQGTPKNAGPGWDVRHFTVSILNNEQFNNVTVEMCLRYVSLSYSQGQSSKIIGSFCLKST